MKTFSVTMVLVFLLGCAAKVEGTRTLPTPSSEEKKTESGITYYLTKPQFHVDVKARRDKKDAEPAYDIRMVPVPDWKHRYEVRLRSGTLTNDTFVVSLTADGRLGGVGATSVSQAAAITSTLGKVLPAMLKAPLKIPTVAARPQEADYVEQALKAAKDDKKISPTQHDEGKKVVGWYRAGADPGNPPGCDFAAVYAAFSAAIEKANNGYRESLKANDHITTHTQASRLAAVAKVWSSVRPQDAQKMLDKVGRMLNEGIARMIFDEWRMESGEEDSALKAYDVLSRFRASAQAITESNSATNQIRQHLVHVRAKAEQAYADYVRSGTGDLAVLKEYTAIISRVLEYDAQFRETKMKERMESLRDYLSRGIPRDANSKRSRAHRDYRAELDLLAGQVNTRLATLAKPRPNARKLPGTEVTRTLSDVLTCEESYGPEDLAHLDGRLRKLAALWLEFGGVKAVIFLDDAGEPRPTDPTTLYKMSLALDGDAKCVRSW